MLRRTGGAGHAEDDVCGLDRLWRRRDRGRASYAHLKKGSVKVKIGERVHRGQLLAQLGQSGNSAAPHLHFQLSNAATFEGAEGLPYVFENFEFFGPESEAQLFGQGEAWKAPAGQRRRMQMPLNDVIVGF